MMILKCLIFMGGATIAADCQSKMAVFVVFWPKTIGPFCSILQYFVLLIKRTHPWAEIATEIPFD